jgi:hypothetical protein
MNYIKKFKEFFLKEEVEIPKPEPMQSVEEVNLPNGIYDAIIGGYQVDVKDFNISFKTNTGVRCSNCPCKIEVINKKAFVIL